MMTRGRMERLLREQLETEQEAEVERSDRRQPHRPRTSSPSTPLTAGRPLPGVGREGVGHDSSFSSIRTYRESEVATESDSSDDGARRDRSMRRFAGQGRLFRSFALDDPDREVLLVNCRSAEEPRRSRSSVQGRPFRSLRSLSEEPVFGEDRRGLRQDDRPSGAERNPFGDRIRRPLDPVEDDRRQPSRERLLQRQQEQRPIDERFRRPLDPMEDDRRMLSREWRLQRQQEQRPVDERIRRPLDPTERTPQRPLERELTPQRLLERIERVKREQHSAPREDINSSDDDRDRRERSVTRERRRPRPQPRDSSDEDEVRVAPPKFREGNNWDVFLMKFEDYVQSARLKTKRFDLVLLQCIQDDKFYRKIKRLNFNLEEQQEPRNLVQFVRHATTTVTSNAESHRLKLKNIVQEEWETVEDFADRIRDIAETAFPGRSEKYLESRKVEALQDGVSDTAIAELICELREQKLDFESIAIWACKKELTKKALKDRRDPDDRVNKIRPAASTSTGSTSNLTSSDRMTAVPIGCNYCGRPGHVAAQCYALTLCQLCKKTGHTATYCPKWTGRTQGRGNWNQSGSRSASSERDQRSIDRENRACFRCHQPGHRADSCTATIPGQSSGNGSAVGTSLPAPGR